MKEMPTKSRVRRLALATVRTLMKKMSVEMAQGLKPSSSPPTATTETVNALALVCTTDCASAWFSGGGCGAVQPGFWRPMSASLTRSHRPVAITS